MNIYAKWLLFGMCLLAGALRAQRELIDLRRANGRVEVPFEYVNDFIVVPVVLNRTLPLRFIFDTGAENTIITHREITDILQVNYSRRITLYGADMVTELEAYVAPGIDMLFNDQLRIASQALLVMGQDYFHFEENIGIDIHGILGADILRRFVITIDYQRRIITFEDPQKFTPPKGSTVQKAPVTFLRHKPYLTTPASVVHPRTRDVKLLMDTGAGLALLLYAHTDSLLNMPVPLIRTSIGHGLGGRLEGYVGRTAALTMGGQQLLNVITNFQEIDSTFLLNSLLLDRDGLLGNHVLSRFHVTIDYVREAVYLKPNKNYRKAFTFDRSGISLIVTGPQLNTYIVLDVVVGSPADQAGVRKGDELRTINRIPAQVLGLDAVARLFKKKTGKKFKLLLRRGEERIVVDFALRDII